MGLLPARHNIAAWKGATYATQIVVFSDEGNTVRDLTDCIAEFSIFDGTGPLLSATTAIDPSAGTVDVEITDEQTLAAAWRTAKYEFAITSPDGTRDVYLYGSVNLRSA